MKNSEDTKNHPPQWEDNLDDTLPSMPADELHARLARQEEQTELIDTGAYRPQDPETLSKQDEIVTPPPLAPPADIIQEAPPPPRASTAMRVVVSFCLLLGLISLLLSGFLIYKLMDTQQAAVESLDSAIEALDSFGGQGFHYEYKFEEEVPFSGDIPFQQDLVFPFEGEIPINTTVEVPIRLGTQTFLVKVPIDTSVYVDTEVPVSIDQTVHVSTSLPVSLTIPIDVKPDDPMLRDLLSNVREWLVRLRESF
jgi:hypothetical protein